MREQSFDVEICKMLELALMLCVFVPKRVLVVSYELRVTGELGVMSYELRVTSFDVEEMF